MLFLNWYTSSCANKVVTAHLFTTMALCGAERRSIDCNRTAPWVLGSKGSSLPVFLGRFRGGVPVSFSDGSTSDDQEATADRYA